MIEWPNGARCACAITFDIDADSLIRTALPDNGHDRLQQVTMGRYGPTVAMPRILDTYARMGLKQTFFMPAWCMERYPETVDAMLEAGHEVAHHSWRHENPATHSDEIEPDLAGKRNATRSASLVLIAMKRKTRTRLQVGSHLVSAFEVCHLPLNFKIKPWLLAAYPDGIEYSGKASVGFARAVSGSKIAMN
ncbi:MAG: polysaccharide deacetylase family protein [Granulosicoccus sp.]